MSLHLIFNTVFQFAVARSPKDRVATAKILWPDLSDDAACERLKNFMFGTQGMEISTDLVRRLSDISGVDQLTITNALTAKDQSEAYDILTAVPAAKKKGILSKTADKIADAMPKMSSGGCSGLRERSTDLQNALRRL